MIIVQLSHGLALISSYKDRRVAILKEALSSSRFNFLFSRKNLAKQLVLVAKGIFKLNDSQRKTLGR
jgi:hypothetical protein